MPTFTGCALALNIFFFDEYILLSLEYFRSSFFFFGDLLDGDLIQSNLVLSDCNKT